MNEMYNIMSEPQNDIIESMEDTDWYMYSLFLELHTEDLEKETQELECINNLLKTVKEHNPHDFYKHSR
jgi:hypothetical protein